MSTTSPVLVLSPSWRDTLASLLERQELAKQRYAVPVENATKGLSFVALLQHMQKAAEADPVLKDLIIPYATLDTNLQHEHNIRSPPPQRAAKCIYAARAARMAGVQLPVGHPDPTSVPNLILSPVAQHREPAGENLPATPNRTKYRTQDMMLRAISSAHSGFLADQPSQAVFSHLLAQLLQVTDCEYGFVGDKLYGEDGKPYLKTRALTNISWNSETREFYEANVHSGFEFKNLNSLFGHTLVTDELVISNNPKGDPRSCGGVPPGHPPMHSYLGLPLRSGKQVIGMVGLANRPGGFDEEVAKFLEPMLSACTNLIEAYNTKRLREQVKAEILQANQQLEENVKQRTQELTVKNQALEDEVEFRKKIEIQLKLAKEQADRASEAKGIFLSTMSHELRTPLNGVIGMVEVLMDTSLNDEQKEIANTISRSAITLHYLINNILDVSKLEAGKLEFAKACLSVRECLEESTYMVAVLAHQKDLDLVIDIDPNVPYFVMGDIGKLKQIIVNLVHNAVKFTESGSVILSCKAIPEGENRTVLQVAITDTGIGISEKNLRNLFQMFSQADQSVSQRYGGSGLGLYLTKQLIQFMGGKLSVDSIEGKGSCFSFTLPVEIDTSAGPQPTPVLKHNGVPLKFGIIGLRSGTQHVLQEYLTQWGGEIVFSDITTLENSQDQLDFVFFGPPSVLEKQCLAQQDGVDLLRKVEYRAKNVVLIRSIASLKPHPFAADLPNAGYLMEPLRPSAILQFIQNHMHGIDSNGSKTNLIEEVKPAAVKTPEGSPKMGEQRRSSEPLMGLKVLLVDDNIVNCQVGQRLVKRLNHECHIAISGAEAVQKFNAEHYDVIFMDLVMPEMDGFKATQLIREAEEILQRPHRTPIIALTAAGITREELLTQGFDDLASKPITGNELRAVLSANCRK